MIRSFRRSIWGALCMFVIAVLLMACGSNDNSKEIAKLEGQIAEKQAIVEKAQGEIDTFQATVVAGRDEIASLEATVQALTAEGNQDVAVQEQPTAESAEEQGQFSIVPVSIETQPAGNGWTDYTVRLAFVNGTDDFVTAGNTSSQILTTITTMEGYEYDGVLKFIGFPRFFPAKLNLAGWLSGEGYLYVPTLTFQAANNSHPVRAVIDGWGPVDISSTVSVIYPTNMGREGFDGLDYTVVIPGKGTLSFWQATLTREVIENSESQWFQWTLTIPATFQNANQGYDTSVALDCYLVDNNGDFQQSPLILSAGPGLTVQNNLTWIVGMTDEDIYSTTSSEKYRAFHSKEWHFKNADLANALIACSGQGIDLDLLFALPTLP